MDWENFCCPECGYTIYKTTEVFFKNGTKHLEARCDSCDKYVGYAPQDWSGVEPKDYAPDFGKHKNKRLEQIQKDEPGYLYWMGENIKGLPGEMARRFLNIIDTGEDLN